MDEAFETLTGNSLWGLALAGIAGVAILGRRRLKPLAKTVVKGSLVAGDWVRERSAGAAEQWQDLYAEAKYEYRSARAGEQAVTDAEPGGKRRRRTVAPTAEVAATT